MKRLSILFALILIALPVNNGQEENYDRFRISAHVGYLFLLEKPLSQIYSDNAVFGGEVGFMVAKNLEIAAGVDIFNSSYDGLSYNIMDLAATHVRTGVYYHFNPSGINPRLGVGLNYSWAEYDLYDIELDAPAAFDETALGFFVSASVEIPVSDSILAGFEVLYTFAKTDYNDLDYNYDYNFSDTVFNVQRFGYPDMDWQLALANPGWIEPDLGGLSMNVFIKFTF